MPSSRSEFTVERFELANGLRVVVVPDRSSPSATVAVYYDVGFRSEPEGRTGFAHLFEHLMFEGSASLPKLAHAKMVQGNGGNFNGSTSFDYTNYFEQLPSGALELGLFLEADRMRAPRLDLETLHNQIAVVKEEIRVNVLNRPYGGFPWIELPPVLFRSFNNAHNGYGSFVDLESVTVEDAVDFWTRYYAPGNAVLSITGDVTTEAAHRLVERHFGDVPGRKVARPSDTSEPVPDQERRGVHHDPMAPTPALAVAWRVPDPLDTPRYAAMVMAAQVLGGGDASRLHQRLVKKDQLATVVGTSVSAFGDPFEVRDPTFGQLICYYQDAPVERLLTVFDEECARLAHDGLEPGELQRSVNAWASGYYRHLDNQVQRGLTAAVLEQQRGRAELLNELPSLLGAVTEDDVVSAVGEWLSPSRRAVLEWRAGPAPAPAPRGARARRRPSAGRG
ncbi:MAG TPA: pitrilysin family protein [Acidimicrobiales bacterium]